MRDADVTRCALSTSLSNYSWRETLIMEWAVTISTYIHLPLRLHVTPSETQNILWSSLQIRMRHIFLSASEDVSPVSRG